MLLCEAYCIAPKAAVERVRLHDRLRAGDRSLSLAAGAAAAAAGGLSVTDGFSGGRWRPAWSRPAWRFGPRLPGAAVFAALGLDDLRLRGRLARRARGGVGVPPRPILRARLQKKPSDCAVGAADGDPGRAGAGARAPRARLFRRAEQQVRPATGARGGLTVEGMVPGARDSASSDRPWPSPPSDSPVLPSGTRAANTLFMPPSMPVLSPRDRRALGDQLGGLGLHLPAASRARRRRFHRRSHRPGIWRKPRTPDRAWRSAP